jgi:hypothetical protein
MRSANQHYRHHCGKWEQNSGRRAREKPHGRDGKCLTSRTQRNVKIGGPQEFLGSIEVLFDLGLHTGTPSR